MAVNRAGVVDRNFIERVGGFTAAPRRQALDEPVRPGTSLSARAAIRMFESQVESRHLDLAARALKARNQCFYTIGSSGHEGNAAVAAASRPDDPAFLHYRSGAFFIERARQVPGSTPVMDVLLGLVASSDEPIAGGRHKVFGSLPLDIPPQTSTIASQLPKALGMALAIERGRRAGPPLGALDDSRIVIVTFGDASINHTTATGAINAARWAVQKNLPCPVLFVCEDNGIGISTDSPPDWVRTAWGDVPNLAYVPGDGLDLPDAFDAATAAVTWVRAHRHPALLHLRTVRMLGHAGSDVEGTYRTPEQIAASEARDPLIQSARLLVEQGWLTPDEVLSLYEETRVRVAALGEEAIRRPKLTRREDVIAPLAPLDPVAVDLEASRVAPGRLAHLGSLPEADKPRHLAVQINRALADLLYKYPEALLFGEDVAKKGGVYNVTTGLQARFGEERVFDTLLDETTILGMAIGAGQAGQLPLPEIQYLAYFHNACDQLRGEACSLQYFSNGQFKNPMVVRVAGFAYQKGFGGHFHNDNSIAALRDIPGLIVAAPGRPDDAVAMLRTLVAAARVSGAVAMFIEPIALYMTRDLYEDGDGAWAAAYPPPDEAIPIGAGRIYGQGEDLLIVSWANGLWMSLRAAKKLEAQGISCRVLDLRWISPLPVADLRRHAEACRAVLVVDETRRTGGVSEGVFAALIDSGVQRPLARVASTDCYIPLGEAANLVLVSERDIMDAAVKLVNP